MEVQVSTFDRELKEANAGSEKVEGVIEVGAKSE